MDGFVRYIENRITNQPRTRATIKQERINTCMRCDSINKVGKLSNCRICGCFVYAKADEPAEKCPLGKW